MILHIAKREILDNMKSLRSLLAFLLIVSLMGTSAIAFVSSYKQKLKEHSRDVNEDTEQLRKNCSSLSKLMNHPVKIFKHPSCLSFIAEGKESELPEALWIGVHGIQYPKGKKERSLIRSFLELDWAFIIGFIVSFVALSFTFDSISGEKEKGTLKLVLSNSIPRYSVILGKYLGTMVSLSVPVLSGMFICLIIVNLSGVISLEYSDWTNIAIVVFISFIYISTFVTLGFLFSSITHDSSLSLLGLLFVWTLFLFVIPGSSTLLSKKLYRLPTAIEVTERKLYATKEINERYKAKGIFSEKGTKRMWADYFNEMHEVPRKIDDELVRKQLRQVELGRKLSLVSPASVLQRVFELISWVGFEREKELIRQARLYRTQVVDFLKSEDMKDSDSLHIYWLDIYGPEGHVVGVSQKPVAFESFPKFKEQKSLTKVILPVLENISILLLFNFLFFLAGFFLFLSYDVR